MDWWKRRPLWQKIAIVVVVVGGIGAAFSPDDKATEDTASPSTSVTTPEVAKVTTPEVAEVTTPEVAEATTTEPPTTAPPSTEAPAMPGISDPVRDGKFEFVVTGVSSPGATFDPDGVLSDDAAGTWFIVSMTVENIGDGEQTFFAGDQVAIWDGKEFSAEDFTWNGSNSESLNPGVRLDATLLFDVSDAFPADGLGVVLELHDSMFSGGVEVALS